jgi:hypothetical protein
MQPSKVCVTDSRRNTRSFQLCMQVAVACMVTHTLTCVVLHVQVPSPVRLGSAVMTRPTLTRQCHGQRRLDSVMVNIVSAASSPVRLGSDVRPQSTSTRQHHNQHWLASVIVCMTWGFDTYFPDQSSDLEVHHRSDLEA